MPSLHDVLRRALDEIALEGRDGCALPRLWTLLDRDDALDEAARDAIWRALAAREADEIAVQFSSPGEHATAAAAAARGARLIAGHAPRLRALGLTDELPSDMLHGVLEQVARARHVGIPATKVSSEKRGYLVEKLVAAGFVCKSFVRIAGEESTGGNVLWLKRFYLQVWADSAPAPAAAARVPAPGERRLRPEDSVRNSAASHRPSHEWSASWHRAWIRRAVREIRERGRPLNGAADSGSERPLAMTFAGCRDAIRESGDEQAITSTLSNESADASDAVMGGVVMQRHALFQSISRAENKHLIDGVRRHVAASDGPRLLEVFWGKPNVLTGEIACLNDDGADRNHAAAKVSAADAEDTATDQAAPDATLSARRPQWCLRLARAGPAAATVKVEGDVSARGPPRAVMPTPAWAFEEGLEHSICSAIGGSGVAGTTLRELCAHLGCESKMLGKARAPLLRCGAPLRARLAHPQTARRRLSKNSPRRATPPAG